MKNEKAYVYLIRCEGSDFYKIGVSHHPKERLYSLQIGCPYCLILTYEAPFTHRNAYKVECAIHERFWETRHWNEWFILTEDDVKRIVDLLHLTPLVFKK